MLYNNILRFCVSCIRRAPGQLNRQIHTAQYHTTQVSRLISSNRCGALSSKVSISKLQNVAHVRCYSEGDGFTTQNRKKFNNSSGEERLEEIRSKVQELLNNGKIQLPEPRNVTCLPPKIEMTGNESFIACEITHRGTYPDIDTLMINATSGTGQFTRVCNPHEELHPTVEYITGMKYDASTQQLMKDGEPLETVEPKEAFQDFAEFLKGHENPVLMHYSKFEFRRKFATLCKRYGLYEEMMSAVPLCLNLGSLVKQKIPYDVAGGRRLDLLCERILGLDIPTGSQLKRTEGIYRLFTEYLQEKGFANIVDSSEYDVARTSLLPLFVDRNLHYYAMDKLARAGISLDHLKFLKEKGFDEFNRCLQERQLSYADIKGLYEFLSKN